MLRLLLLHVRGAQSYEQLRTVTTIGEDGKEVVSVCDTFEKAC